MGRLAEELRAALSELRKAVFSQPTREAEESRVTARPVMLKGELRFQTESIRDNKAMHRNLTGEELIELAERLEGKYRQVLIMTQSESRQYCLKANGAYRRSGATASVPLPAPVQSHNREKRYILEEGENIPALVELGIFTKDFKIVKAKYDKYKQINRFVELIDHEFSRSDLKEISILDFGCGKSYLTFILYYYFTVKRGVKARITGYDLKEDVVEHCNEIARRYGYDALCFEKADVTRDTLAQEHIDMVVTLHACDIATDYALSYAIQKGVKYIFSVPCCQHEVNNSIQKGGELDLLLEHGIIKERMSALLTDAIRAAVLEDMGYETDMIEFIDFAHSPKNIMIRARYTGRRRTRGRRAAKALQERYGFKQKLLELTEDRDGEK